MSSEKLWKYFFSCAVGQRDATEKMKLCDVRVEQQKTAHWFYGHLINLKMIFIANAPEFLYCHSLESLKGFQKIYFNVIGFCWKFLEAFKISIIVIVIIFSCKLNKYYRKCNQKIDFIFMKMPDAVSSDIGKLFHEIVSIIAVIIFFYYYQNPSITMSIKVLHEYENELIIA